MIKSKLKSNRGATLIFALVALLVATMVSAVIIYAAESNARRVRADQAAEQARLTLNSAASLVRNEIVGDRYDSTVVVETTTVTNNNTIVSKVEGTPAIHDIYMEKQVVSGVESWATKYDSDPALAIADTRTTMENSIYTWANRILSKTDTDTTSSLVCSDTFYITADNMDEVKVELSMQPGALMDQTDDVKAVSDAEKYYLTAVLTLSDETNRDTSVRAEKIVMTFMANDPVEHITSTPVSSTSTTETDGEGNTIVKATTVLSVKKEISINWADEKVVVNVFTN